MWQMRMRHASERLHPRGGKDAEDAEQETEARLGAEKGFGEVLCGNGEVCQDFATRADSLPKSVNQIVNRARKSVIHTCQSCESAFPQAKRV